MSEQRAKEVFQKLSGSLSKSIRNFKQALSKNPSLDKSRNNLEQTETLLKKFQDNLTESGSFLFTEQ
jgi:hypothetical protein